MRLAGGGAGIERPGAGAERRRTIRSSRSTASFFEFNRILDGLLLEPAARIYRGVTPQFLRDAVNNFLDNLRTPVVLANDLLQGELYRAEQTLGRFMLNTIMGVGGLVDVGGLLGMPERHNEDFGQTLAVYGVGEGPYLVLPLLGPSNPRDTFGLRGRLRVRSADLSWRRRDIALARFGTDASGLPRAEHRGLRRAQASSIDLYAATRTLARQLRASEIRNGAPAPIDDIYDEDLYDLDGSGGYRCSMSRSIGARLLERCCQLALAALLAAGGRSVAGRGQRRCRARS